MHFPVTTIKGIGKEAAISLTEMGIYSIANLLDYFPYRYEDFRLKNLEETQHDERVTVEGKIYSEPLITSFGKKKTRLTVRVLVGRNLIQAVFFNQPFLKKQIELHDTVTITGKWDRHRQMITAQLLQKGPQIGEGTLEPVYSLKGTLRMKTFRKWMKAAFVQYAELIEETLPEELLERYKIPKKKNALYIIHFPSEEKDLKHARRRFIYEELLQFQLKMQALRKFEREHSAGNAQNYDLAKVKHFIKSLPFELTPAQKKVVNEIAKDLKLPFRMNRLLQGDVGSGKTVVAAISLFSSITAGYQGALMVPTEILAEQHAESLSTLLGPMGVNIALLTGSVKGKKRKLLLERLAKGEIDLLIGTHALIQDEVDFNNLGLVITDEQHRFGVNQRKVLREKGENPDVLFMTATPIPRTLAITVFGEMDISTIDQMPAGRKEIETSWVKHEMLDEVLDLIKKELRQGRQSYVICPLIEESDKIDVQNAIDVYGQLSEFFGLEFKIGLMHGRLSSVEKEDVMKSFTVNDIQLLVSTTVVEVGVNVPNATMMLIYDAERFGLSQLHQLRGRVGRGEHQSYCILLANPKTEIGKERMQAMTETTDGFVLSEKDLELRGPGDFFGRKQSGLPEFKVADLVHDYRALEVARNDAKVFIESESFWSEDRFLSLRENLQQSGAMSGEKLD
jgi:ATP-dependent DNA helicase RecG